MSLTEAQRREIFEKVARALREKLAVPKTPTNLDDLQATHEQEIVNATDPTAFEHSVNGMLKGLGISHLGFFNEAQPRAAGRIAIAATFLRTETPDGIRWMFQDVHRGGLADNAGIQPGDILLSLDDKDIVPPDAPTFALGRKYRFTFRNRDGNANEFVIDIPASADKKRPLIVPTKVVTAEKLNTDIGYIRVSMFPGVLGLHVARDLSAAVRDLDCSRLIFDLRGNSGGGIGCLRLMSLLCADKRGVGYAVDRKDLQNGSTRDRLPHFDGIPSSKLAVIPLALRFGFGGRSVALFSEGLGARKHHGRTVILQNEHSASASEMALAFASEYKLAPLVGTKSPGRVVGASSVKVGYGYRLALPIAAYFTWENRNLEGVGVATNIEEAIASDALRAGEDNQLHRAAEVVTQL
jgi:carboxyl-terminal processing protease